MKKYILLLIFSSFLFSCSDNGFNNKNPYLPNYTFTLDLNMNMPAYSSLQYPSEAIYYPGAGTGSGKGIFVFNTGSGYNAFDAACPNQALSSCSTMTLKGINVVCACDSKEYSLFTGQAQGGAQYPLKQYRVEVNGNVLRVYN